MKCQKIIKRGEIYYADLSPAIGSEQGGLRPVVVISNNIGNQHSPTVIVAAITSRLSKARLPTHVEIKAQRGGLPKNSVVLCEQIRTLDKSRLKEYVFSLSNAKMHEIDNSVSISFALVTNNIRISV